MQVYIGQTVRKLQTIINEHRRKVRNFNSQNKLE